MDRGRAVAFAAALCAAAPPPCAAQREPVLKQVGLPHPYYWREMYVPQVTSGPSAATWSPDGTELIYSMQGSLWRQRIGSGVAELRYEETTWKARPDWSPDGTRVVYASYLGRQWHQLWLMTSDGGDPLPLTYGDFDATAPRWSRDGRRIAYVSNESGNTSLWVIDVLGGRKQPVEPTERRYREPVGTLRIVIADRAGRTVPARISVVGRDGRGYAPDNAWRHADEAFDRSERRFEYGYFHSSGTADLTVPAGWVSVEVWRGPEYRMARADVAVPPGGRVVHRVVLERLADLPARGWWSGDMHVHMNYGGAYRNTPRQLAFQARAEDLHVVENLIVNKEQRIPDIAYFRTDPRSGVGSRRSPDARPGIPHELLGAHRAPWAR